MARVPRRRRRTNRSACGGPRGRRPRRHGTARPRAREVPMAASAGAQWSIRRRGRGSSAGCVDATRINSRRKVDCHASGSTRKLEGKKLEKRGAVLPLRAFARFYATDGRNACSARIYLLLVPLSLRLMLAHFSSSSVRLSGSTRARPQIHACVRACESVKECALRAPVHSSHITSSCRSLYSRSI